MDKIDISPEAAERIARIIETQPVLGRWPAMSADTAAMTVRALRSALTASEKRIEKLEALAQQVKP